MLDYKKYELILERLASKMTWLDITTEISCSMSTISKAVKWKKAGKPKQKVKQKSSSVVSSGVVNNKNSSRIKRDLEAINDTLMAEFDITKLEIDIKYNSRFLSWMAFVLTIPSYWKLSKKELVEQIHKKIDSI